MRKYQYFLILAIYGLIIFSPSLTSGFAFDDTIQIVNNQKLHHIENVSYFLTSGINSPLKDNQYFTFYYRPLLFMYYTVLYYISHGNALYFHNIQLTIFLLDTFLIFIFFSKFFSRNLSFILALTFLTHPINQTLGAYITDFHDTLYLFFGLLALLVISSKLKIWFRAVLSSILLFLSLLSIEAGILFLPASLLYGKLTSKYKIRIFLPILSLFISFYLWMRYISYQNHFFTYLSSYPINQPLVNRIMLIPTLIFYYYKEIFRPELSVPRVKEIILHSPHPYIILGTHLALILSGILYAFYLKKHKPEFLKKFLFFIFWFLIGLILYIQIIPLDMLIARRWLTFSLIGILGILGVTASTFPLKSKKLKLTFKILYMLYIFSLSITILKLNYNLNEWWLHLAPTP